MDVGDGLLRALWATAHGLEAMSKRMDVEHGVTAPQRLVLRVLARQPNRTAGEVAAAVGLHPSTVTGILRRLEQRGHLSRSADPSDRRAVRLAITPTGAALDQLDTGTVESVVRRVLTTLPPEDIAVTTRVLDQLSTALSTAAREPRR